jgi:trans-aconitate 2-methyltransferase
VWKYGSSLLDLIDVEALVALETAQSQCTSSTGISCSGDSGRRILRAVDVGCGSGQLTQQLYDRLLEEATKKYAARTGSGPTDSDGANIDVRVLGMDLDPSMLQSARRNFPSLEFFAGDVRTLRLDAQVHLIFSNAALHWVPFRDFELVGESLGRALMPGGHFVAEFGGKGNLRTIVKAMKQVFPPPQTPDSWHYPSIAEFAGILEQHGRIEVVSASLYDRPTPLEQGEDGMKNWIGVFGSKYWRHLELTAEQLDAKVDEAIQLLRQTDLYEAATKQWTADYRRIRVVGRKM